MKRFGEIVKGFEYEQRPGSYGVAIKNGQIAVIKSSIFDKYFLIGGGIKNGETEIETLHREALEEIGFKIEIVEKIGAAVEYFYAELDGKYIAKECNFYRVLIKDKIKIQSENQLIWIDKDELQEMYHQSHQWILENELNRVNAIT